MYEEVVSTMFADFFAIALGLADTGKSDDAQSCQLTLEGKVREVISTGAVVSGTVLGRTI